MGDRHSRLKRHYRQNGQKRRMMAVGKKSRLNRHNRHGRHNRQGRLNRHGRLNRRNRLNKHDRHKGQRKSQREKDEK